MKKSIFIVFMIFLLAGCAHFQNSPSVCEGVSDSVICDVLYKNGFSTPEQANLILKVAAASILENNRDECENTLNFIDTAIAFIERGISYNLIGKFLRDHLPAALEITASEILDGIITFNIPISDFDKNLLLEHLRQQREIVIQVCGSN